MADELFNQADQDKDQRLDLNEFRNLLALSMGIRPRSNLGRNKGSSNSHKSSSSAIVGNVRSTNGSYCGVADPTGPIVRAPSFSSYDQSSHALSSSVHGDNFDATASLGSNVERKASPVASVSGFESNRSGGYNLNNGTEEISSSLTFKANNSEQENDQLNSNPQGLFHDPNPEIIRRPAQGEAVTYTQSIKIRFLQPPPVPPPGPLIIKEVRPPQPPPPPPLRIRQQAPPLRPPSPLILRERPPPIPAAIAAQTVIRQLPALAAPPRSVIIERLPAFPAKPRDIIIERWIPYGAAAKRKTIVQRAEGQKPYPKPRNIIIQYEPVSVRINRQFQRLGITPENPQAYVQRYNTSLLDSQSLVQQARAAGVVEDISPPNVNAVTNVSSSNAEGSRTNSRIESNHGGTTSPLPLLESSNNVNQQEKATVSSFEGGHDGSRVGSVSSSRHGSNSFSAQGNTSTSGFETFNASAGQEIDPATVAFKAADLNQDGALDPHEFRQFLSSQFED